MRIKKVQYFTDPRPIGGCVKTALDFGADEVRVRVLSTAEQQRLGDRVSTLNYEIVVVLEGEAE